MNSNFSDDIESNQYFQSLPIYIQETIKQSGIKIESEEDLKKIATKLMTN